MIDESPHGRGVLQAVLPHAFTRIEGMSRSAPVTTGKDLICAHQLDGRIVSVNDHICEALGMSAETLCSMSVLDLIPAVAVTEFAACMDSLKRRGFNGGLMAELPDGSRRIWEYRNEIDTETVAPVCHALARDVTEREEAFHAVRRSEEHFRSIIENISEVISIVELDGRVRYHSPSVQRVLGYLPERLVGTHFLDLTHPDDAERARQFLTRQNADARAREHIELRTRHHNGTWRSFDIVANNLIKSGESTAIVMTARDITERKLLEAQLLQANRLAGLGRLAATVAHEFNNVLMGMQPFAELMQRPQVTPAIVSRGAANIANSIQRGKRIVLDILRFTRPSVPVAAPVDLGQWWEEFAPEAELVLGNMVALVSTVPPRDLCALADRMQLSQVMINLFSNARDAMTGAGTITVEARALEADATFSFGVVENPAAFLQISVRDTDHGMPAEILEHIFEPLYTTRQSGGTGLGLAVAHQIMVQHGGYIFAESEYGRGSTFHLFIPRAVPKQRSEGLGALTAAKPGACRLLIIDDETTIAEGIAAVLAVDGIEVESIGSGLLAEAAIARFRPDVVLLDLGLPDIDGVAVYRRIREIDSKLPVVFGTGHGDRRALHDELGDPYTRFLQKPFEVTELLDLIAEFEGGGAN